eukprot:CAMPEP_0179216370 /NCGR_PEP_ID=MMETSP0797-20121207/3342_1 /TAXON_ID=47934 /ORGANISM="Dinophysis acuminata, Strain DAEP01" /LENGTH=56 /DNA_ID=CAMNT_0020922523 /DNA_START=77 /DNA_END=244 /DNA_ORIENTATION=+
MSSAAACDAWSFGRRRSHRRRPASAEAQRPANTLGPRGVGRTTTTHVEPREKVAGT